MAFDAYFLIGLVFEITAGRFWMCPDFITAAALYENVSFGVAAPGELQVFQRLCGMFTYRSGIFLTHLSQHHNASGLSEGTPAGGFAGRFTTRSAYAP